ncbi:MAG: peptide deformylase [Patescibacteria group bacterium]|nr:peptide deformylase [Patescibacteria group bacterium]
MKLEIVKYPNPILTERSKKISRIDDSITKLAQDMIETMKSFDNTQEVSAAMAAIQVGVPLRMTVLRDGTEFLPIINPEIVKHGKEEFSDIEGCMSVPKKYGQVKRYKKIKVRGLDLSGKKIEIKAEGFLARVLQHEIDHMNGNLFLNKVPKDEIYRLSDNGKLIK